MNLTKTKKRWEMIKKVLIRDKAQPKVMGYFYKAICQAILLYGSESWVLTDVYKNRLTAFHHKIACNLTGIYGRPDSMDADGGWIYPDMSEVLEKDGLYDLDTYIDRRRNTLRQNYALGSSRYNMCVNRRVTNSRGKRFWWDIEYICSNFI